MATKFKVVGIDINRKRVDELLQGIDKTNEVTSAELKSRNIKFTTDKKDLAEADFHIVAVPTPVDAHQRPDLTPMFKASEMIGSVLKKGDIVVYESTVYPGVCEEECLPILEKFSGLKGGVDFKIGYSPERINPGDHLHRFTTIKKIVAAQDAESLETVASVYGAVVEAGVHRVTSIKVAEAAKVIENTQRDLNIALVNELSIIFDKMNIDTNEVIEAAGTKWNFIKFKPGLVGGHCIGVDPYYLTFKAESLGYHPQVILSGRRINDSMGKYVAERCVKEIIHAGGTVKGAVVSLLGLTFKENCPDLRNSKVVDIYEELKDYGIEVQIFDPKADPQDVLREYGVAVTPMHLLKKSDAFVLAVAHDEFKNFTPKHYRELSATPGVFIDVKGAYSRSEMTSLGFRYWSL